LHEALEAWEEKRGLRNCLKITCTSLQRK
jgi:hypothetical protein